ncbi:DUF1439 domain-containing protein [Basfia succiniciproducens]|uniref:DUF1439 domain-containing protein n=1 Tax=Basfia succiniciproducens TaxID=653940 RepID=A0A1G5C9X5_9PAST|nr:DUF1439 domain-containing protein [Basfia succiniciproducens]QIM68740.1 hypothetical protein A4G13_04740 [Basfia succiniciproducens]SCX99118.1 Protein of unknown function [Basfia succiniciproducens]SEP80456.1 Protein of unknown function [Basfia succiniciproducens]
MFLSRISFYFTLVCGLIIAMVIAPSAKANMFSVSETEINQYLSKKGEIADKIGFPGLFAMDYKVQNLTAKVGQNNDGRVELSGTIDGLLNLQKNDYVGKIDLTLDTIPYYDAEKGAVYLRDLRITNWTGSPQQYMEKLEPMMPFLSRSLAALMATMPIYTLDESKPRDMLIKKFAKGIRVEKGQLSLDAGIL